ncbi:hypothetical protein HRR99_20580 [Agrobacterium vaccinii]|uniref:hypothetical protein n=1 Tax=Agrobacterium vaccinii TaxID=2735528 RepID=UPI001E5CED3A|nr:hypothetical protein [Agrobacterium vaccinii]UHS63916.1 hypothetical protein HRR99_20580 [Agrobacterium vaccinii]
MDPMNKLSRLFVRRLERIARREARRNAHINGLLNVKIIEIGGHVLRRYAPAFDTTRLSGDPERDLAWLRRNFGGYLMPPPPASDIVVTETKPLASILPFLLPRKQAASYQPALDMHAVPMRSVSSDVRAGHRWSVISLQPSCCHVRSKTVACRFPGLRVLPS